jgi:hypothetical protein
MDAGIYIPGLSKEQLFSFIKETVTQATKEVLDKSNGDILLTQEEATCLLDISKTTIIKWGKIGLIKPKEVGGRVFYLKSDLLKIGEK